MTEFSNAIAQGLKVGGFSVRLVDMRQFVHALWLCGLLCLLYISALLRPTDIIFILLSGTAHVSFGILIWSLLQRKMFFSALFSCYFLYSILVVWIANLVLGAPLSSWRGASYDVASLINILSTWIMVEVGFAITMFFVLSVLRSKELYCAGSRGLGANKLLVLDVGLPSVVGVALILLAVASVGMTSRQEFVDSSDSGGRSIVLASMLGVVGTYGVLIFSETSQRSLRLIVASVLAVGICLLAVMGFRFGLVMLIVLTLMRFLWLRALSFRVALGCLLVAIIAFSALTLFGYSRATGETLGMVLGDVVTGNLSAKEIAATLGGAEQMNLIAGDYILTFPPYLMGSSYVGALLLLLPPGAREGLDPVRIQDFIVQYVGVVPRALVDNQLNIGAHFLIEAEANFGQIGLFMAAMLVPIGAILIDQLRGCWGLRGVLYLSLCSLAYSAAWYGSANFVKQVIFMTAVSSISLLGPVLMPQYRRRRRLRNFSV